MNTAAKPPEKEGPKPPDAPATGSDKREPGGQAADRDRRESGEAEGSEATALCDEIRYRDGCLIGVMVHRGIVEAVDLVCVVAQADHVE